MCTHENQSSHVGRQAERYVVPDQALRTHGERTQDPETAQGLGDLERRGSLGVTLLRRGFQLAFYHYQHAKIFIIENSD